MSTRLLLLSTTASWLFSSITISTGPLNESASAARLACSVVVDSCPITWSAVVSWVGGAWKKSTRRQGHAACPERPPPPLPYRCFRRGQAHPAVCCLLAQAGGGTAPRWHYQEGILIHPGSSLYPSLLAHAAPPRRQACDGSSLEVIGRQIISFLNV